MSDMDYEDELIARAARKIEKAESFSADIRAARENAILIELIRIGDLLNDVAWDISPDRRTE